MLTTARAIAQGDLLELQEVPKRLTRELHSLTLLDYKTGWLSGVAEFALAVEIDASAPIGRAHCTHIPQQSKGPASRISSVANGRA